MNFIKTLATRHIKIIRFAIIGVIAFFVDWYVLKFLVDRETYFLAARLLSFLAAVSVTFTLNKYWTFRDAATVPVLAQFLQFLAANSIGGAVNYIVSTGFYFYVLGSTKRYIWLSLLLGSAAGFIFNFIMSNRFVFRSR